MRGAERVVLALGALGEARQAAALAQRTDTVAPAGEDLVRIGLVADIPDQRVAGRIEHVMDRGGQLDHAEPRAEMAAGHAHRGDHLGPQLVGELAELAGLEAAELIGGIDGIEQRGRRKIGHEKPLLRTPPLTPPEAICRTP